MLNCLRIIVVLLACAASLVVAQSPRTVPRSGQYFDISTSDNRFASAPEVIEFFSYGCSHCAEFQTAMSDMKSRLPASATLRLVPVVFKPQWESFSRAFYASESLGVLERTHQQLFDWLSSQHRSTASLDELATQFYRRFGVDPARFVAIANSAMVTAKLDEAYRLAIASGVDRTPTLTINRQYRIVVDERAGVTPGRAVELALDLLDRP